MILMNWIRKDNGGFTTFRARMSRGTLARFIREQLVAHMQKIYCHEQAALAIYKELAANANNPARRDVFLRLAEAEARQLARRAELLQRLNAHIPCDCDTLYGRAWRRTVLWLGPYYALAWVKHVKRGDVRRQLELMRLLKTLSQ
jgi:hypothetical protein